MELTVLPFASICFAEPETERGAAQDGVEVAEDVCTPDPCCCWLHHGVLLLLVEMRHDSYYKNQPTVIQPF